MSSKEVKQVMHEKITELGSLKDGNHIAVLKEFNGIKYLHHGIFIEPVMVIDFGGTNKTSAQVRKIDIYKFLKGHIELVRFPHTTEICHPPKKVIEIAESLLKNPERWKTFCILSNNCEHFATYCKTGKSYSTQFEAVASECIKNPCSAIECCSASSENFCSSNKKKYKMEFVMEEQKQKKML